MENNHSDLENLQSLLPGGRLVEETGSKFWVYYLAHPDEKHAPSGVGSSTPAPA